MKPDAQKLVYDAMDAWGAPVGIALAKNALELERDIPDLTRHIVRIVDGTSRRLGKTR